MILGFDVVFQLMQVHTFYGAQCSYRHKDGGFDLAVVGCDQTRPRIGARVCILEFKRHVTVFWSLFLLWFG